MFQDCHELATLPDYNLCTLEEVKSAAAGNGLEGQGVTLPGDEEILRLIAAYSSLIEHSINRPRKLLENTYLEMVPGNGGFRVMLYATPIISISSITYRGQSISTNDITIFPDTGILYREQGWLYSGAIWRDIEDTRVANSEAPVYHFTYTGGYASPSFGIGTYPLPPIIRQACIMSVLQGFQTQNRDLTIQRTRIGDFTQTFFAGSSNLGGVRGLPTPVLDMLAPFRRVD